MEKFLNLKFTPYKMKDGWLLNNFNLRPDPLFKKPIVSVSLHKKRIKKQEIKLTNINRSLYHLCYTMPRLCQYLFVLADLPGAYVYS